MLFLNEEEVCRAAVPLGYRFGVLEDVDGVKACTATFANEDDAREFVDYLQAQGRAAVFVDLRGR